MPGTIPSATEHRARLCTAAGIQSLPCWRKQCCGVFTKGSVGQLNGVVVASPRQLPVLGMHQNLQALILPTPVSDSIEVLLSCIKKRTFVSPNAARYLKRTRSPIFRSLEEIARQWGSQYSNPEIQERKETAMEGRIPHLTKFGYQYGTEFDF